MIGGLTTPGSLLVDFNGFTVDYRVHTQTFVDKPMFDLFDDVFGVFFRIGFDNDYIPEFRTFNRFVRTPASLRSPDDLQERRRRRCS